MLSGAALAGTILTAGFAMFPFVMPSSSVPNVSLTVYDAVSSHRTLNLMFIAVVVFLPIVLAYTIRSHPPRGQRMFGSSSRPPSRASSCRPGRYWTSS